MSKRCKNEILQLVLESDKVYCYSEELDVDNDLIRFETLWYNWDNRAILLTKFQDRESVVDITPVGVYTNFGVFARVLQLMIQYHKTRQLYVKFNNDQLDIDVMDSDTMYKASFVDLNQKSIVLDKESWQIKVEPEKEVLCEKVRLFAEAMEERLYENEHKGGWSECTDLYLLSKAVEKLGEFSALLSNPLGANGAEELAEAADAANYLMMLCDNRGLLSGAEDEPEKSA